MTTEEIQNLQVLLTESAMKQLLQQADKDGSYITESLGHSIAASMRALVGATLGAVAVMGMSGVFDANRTMETLLEIQKVNHEKKKQSTRLHRA